jgi:hypothetical protein
LFGAHPDQRTIRRPNRWGGQRVWGFYLVTDAARLDFWALDDSGDRNTIALLHWVIGK